jgi:ribokinase
VNSRVRKPRKPAAQVVVVGSFNHDHVWTTGRFPQPGETRMGRFASGPGGKGFNQAVAAARQGAATLFIGAIGRDALGEAAIALAASEGIDGRWQQVAGEATGSAAILLDGSAQNMIIVAPGANAALSPAQVEAQQDAIRAARVLLTQQEVHPAASLRAQAIARAAGLVCIHNPAPPLDRSADRLLDGADIVTPNESEFAALLAARGLAEGIDPAILATLADEVLHAHCRRLGVPTVVLTLGAAGAFISHADPALRGDAEPYYRVAAEAVRAVDTTGAGDAFNGALAAHLALDPGTALREAVQQATRVAGLAVETHGAALGMPRADEVRRRFG